MQEFICGEHGAESTLTNAMSQCDAFGLRPPEAAAEVQAVIAGWKDHFAQAGVSERDVESLAERIDGDELRGQRQAFDPSAIPTLAPAQARRRPFSR